MYRIEQRLKNADPTTAALSLTLPYERRVISRQKVVLDNGSDAGLFLPRGTVIHEGDVLLTDDNQPVIVNAADEQVSTVHCEESLQLARVCYHLGNRHIPLQIDASFVRYQHDHVLDKLVEGLGLAVKVEQAPFEPEPGAYGGSAHSRHGHGHGHGHEHPDSVQQSGGIKSGSNEQV